MTTNQVVITVIGAGVALFAIDKLSAKSKSDVFNNILGNGTGGTPLPGHQPTPEQTQDHIIIQDRITRMLTLPEWVANLKGWMFANETDAKVAYHSRANGEIAADYQPVNYPGNYTDYIYPNIQDHVKPQSGGGGNSGGAGSGQNCIQYTIPGTQTTVNACF